ncbi:MAG TPA: hypothetical protein H9973_03940 [Candidatus Alistipes cottocaccae]|nr:hypothetical protein [Candidatus Alistipes cottocaccae]
MKRVLLILTAVLLTMTAGAQRPERYEKNLLGVRAGLELSYIRAAGEYVYGTTAPRMGFRLGVSDQVLLWHALPLYVETGVHFASRGGRHAGISFRPMYFQVPLLATWRFHPGKRLRIRPFAGVCYGVGIGGMARTDDGWSELFGSDGILRRSDLTLRAGAEVSWRRICLSAGFDGGSLDLLRPDYQTPLLPAGIERLRSRSFTFCIGYDF